VGSAKRVKDQLEESLGKKSLGGQTNGVFVEPTILTDVKGDDAIMQDELFAPILSIVPVDTFDEAIEFINDRLAFPRAPSCSLNSAV
jgi:acyl-CoA reductase-like NAD-dependent aldehyde dehydrogenase